MDDALKKSLNELNSLSLQLEEMEKDVKKNKEKIREIKKTINKDWENLLQKITKEIPEFIEKGMNEDAICIAESIGKFLNLRELTTSQIRNFFGEVKRIQMKSDNLDINSIALLQPKLVYAAARAKKDGTNDFKIIMNTALKTVMKSNEDKNKTINKFNNFSNFFEAILAYHKSYGGK